MRWLLHSFSRHYPFWLLGFGVLAYLYPPSMLWFAGNWITGALALVMLGMGLTLTPDDFARVLKMPKATILGFVFQYTLMPLTGWFVSWVLRLGPELTVGLIILSSCPGGTASNMVTYLAKANLALSVILTMNSTLLCFIFTPLWIQMLAGHHVEVDGWAIAWTTIKVVVAPVIVGVLCNWLFPRVVKRIQPAGPTVAVLALCFITGGIVAANGSEIVRHAGILIVAVVMLHGLGFLTGYWFTRWMKFSEDVSRVVSIEVGMQNGGMALMLAKAHFAAMPLAAVPMVFSALLQNIMGAIIASHWAKTPTTVDHGEERS